MSNKTCKDCLHCSTEGVNEVYCSGMPWHNPFGGSDTVSLDKEACEHFLGRDKQTVFHRITASPEVLAKEFVTEFSVYGGRSYWCSLLLAEPGHSVFEQRFNTEDEAIAATLARLNSLINDVKEKVE